MRCLMIDPCGNILSSLLQCPTANLWGRKPLTPVCVLRLGHEHHTYTHTLTSTGQVMWPYFPIEPHSLDSTGHLLHTHKHTHSCKCVIWADASHTQSSRGVPLLYKEHILINLRYCAAFMRFKNGFRIFFKHLFQFVITKITGTVTFSTETLLLTFSRGETSPDLRFWHWKKTKRQRYVIQCVWCIILYHWYLWTGQWQHCVGNRNRCGQAVGHSMTIPVCLTSHVDVLCVSVCVSEQLLGRYRPERHTSCLEMKTPPSYFTLIKYQVSLWSQNSYATTHNLNHKH